MLNLEIRKSWGEGIMSAVRYHLHCWEKERRDGKSPVKIGSIGHATTRSPRNQCLHCSIDWFKIISLYELKRFCCIWKLISVFLLIFTTKCCMSQKILFHFYAISLRTQNIQSWVLSVMRNLKIVLFMPWDRLPYVSSNHSSRFHVLQLRWELNKKSRELRCRHARGQPLVYYTFYN